MFNQIQLQRRGNQSWLAGITVILLLLATMQPSLTLMYFFFAGSILQFFFTIRRVWFFYAPILTLAISPLHIKLADTTLTVTRYRTQSHDIFVAMILVVIMLVGLITELVIMSVRRRKIKAYSVLINQANNDSQLFFNEGALTAAGLTDTERSFFKKEVRKQYGQFQLLNSLRPQAQKIVPGFDQDLKMIDDIFHELINAPLQMLEIHDFLYLHLPDYISLVGGLLDMADNPVKTAEDEQLLTATQTDLAGYADLFKADYLQVTEDERQRLKKTVTPKKMEADDDKFTGPNEQ